MNLFDSNNWDWVKCVSLPNLFSHHYRQFYVPFTTLYHSLTLCTTFQRKLPVHTPVPGSTCGDGPSACSNKLCSKSSQAKLCRTLTFSAQCCNPPSPHCPPLPRTCGKTTLPRFFILSIISTHTEHKQNIPTRTTSISSISAQLTRHSRWVWKPVNTDTRRRWVRSVCSAKFKASVWRRNGCQAENSGRTTAEEYLWFGRILAWGVQPDWTEYLVNILI